MINDVEGYMIGQQIKTVYSWMQTKTCVICLNDLPQKKSSQITISIMFCYKTTLKDNSPG